VSRTCKLVCFNGALVKGSTDSAVLHAVTTRTETTISSRAVRALVSMFQPDGAKITFTGE
jgi:hypothetical protein